MLTSAAVLDRGNEPAWTAQRYGVEYVEVGSLEQGDLKVRGEWMLKLTALLSRNVQEILLATQTTLIG